MSRRWTAALAGWPTLALTLWVTVVSGQVKLSGRCPYIPALRPFDTYRFLGKWFEAERFFVSYESLAGRCWGERYVLLGGRVSTLLEWRLALLGTPVSIRQLLGNPDPRDKARFSYVVARPNVPFLRGEYKILATDYKNYAIAWQCENKKLSNSHTEIGWLLTRSRHPSYEVIHAAKAAALAAGLDVRHFQKQDRRGCHPL
ncbi:apolipoprotein D-like [Amphibalanus amphitrite]|uniref:apolipoprotein D-like n=1 Tax=Amphibalanus amphitrite TaxID=1232801 RepID=UPI001C91E767|nr:apolipoprotein D-like [Amphibalanus amphitrite]XP_043200630.1 apolipoprotein D-like [Amphibalanus amphitrite]XP_043202463.1 apolipoprotein D-like [Amphibalanus amphitrite]XP_043202472.1 apolipoprotein D-like [Amphibalanus amphitrite]